MRMIRQRILCIIGGLCSLTAQELLELDICFLLLNYSDLETVSFSYITAVGCSLFREPFTQWLLPSNAAMRLPESHGVDPF